MLPGEFLHSFISSVKIDGREHIGEETVDKGWSDNFLMIGMMRFGKNLHTVPRDHRHRLAGGDST